MAANNLRFAPEPLGKTRTIQENLMPHKLVTIAQFRDLPEAGLAKSRIESAGITCFLENEFTIGANWLYSNALGGVKLKVLEEDAEKAKEVIGEGDSGACPHETNQESLSESVCPKCGGTEIETNNLTRKFAAMSLLTSLPVFFFFKRYRCHKCGFRWK